MAKIKVKIKEEKPESYTKLSVFDFDRTLFRSPDKPKNYDGSWWLELKSLAPPNVPEKPGSDFWIESTVQSAKKELSNSKTYTILLTGRIDTVYDERVRDLLSQRGLNFHYIRLNKMGGDTGEFKVSEIKKILKKFPTVKKIEMWEDEQEKADLYTEEFSKKYQFQINMVK